MDQTMSRTLEFTVLSAEDLRIDNKSLKKNAFVVVSVDPFNYRSTKMDAEGGSYPSWNEKLVMELPVKARFICVEVKCRTSSGDRSVGSARIPASDFIGGYAPENFLQFLSYRLKDEKGRRNGIINLSVRVKVPEQEQEHACSSQAAGLSIRIDGIKNNSGVVTGIPVWAAYQSNSLTC